MALAAGEVNSGGFVRDEDGALVCVAEGGNQSGGFLRDQDGRVVIAGSPNWSEGERLFAYSSQNVAGKKQEVNLGTVAAPDEGNQPVAVFSRVLKTPEASFFGDGAGNLGAIRAHTTAVLGSEGQALGVVGSAITLSKYEAGNSLADAFGGYFVGIAKGESTRTGAGIFVNGRRETASAYTCGMELVSDNEVEGADTYDGSSYPKTNPTGGGILYTEGGKLMYRGSSGTVKELATA